MIIKIGIFYIPPTKTVNFVKKFKSFYKKKCSNSQYLDHLVHLSLYVIEINSNDLDSVLSLFRNLDKNFSSFFFKIEGWKIFKNDIITKLNTLALELKISNDLKKIQISIAKELVKYSLKDHSKQFNGTFKKSYKEWGYPFVGKHWIPHITIGSLDLSEKIITDQLEDSNCFKQPFIINNLHLYQIEKEQHTLLEKIKF